VAPGLGTHVPACVCREGEDHSAGESGLQAAGPAGLTAAEGRRVPAICGHRSLTTGVADRSPGQEARGAQGRGQRRTGARSPGRGRLAGRAHTHAHGRRRWPEEPGGRAAAAGARRRAAAEGARPGRWGPQATPRSRPWRRRS
jgi:hypothetical protein